MGTGTFDSDDMAVEDLFNGFFEVPDYQREYVWESKHVERLLADVYNEFELRTDEHSPEYFLGTIVTTYHSRDDYYELIDGQQRVTTLFVILCAIRDILADADQDIEGISVQLRAMKYDLKGRGAAQYRVKLQYPDSQGVLTQLAQSRSKYSLDTIKTSTRSAKNLVQAYEDARGFLTGDLRADSDLIREFWAYLTKSVRVIRIKTTTLSRALWIFETINKRGTGLNAMDLLKNLLFMKAESEQFETLKLRWKALSDTIFAADETPMRFIRHYLMANYSTKRVQAEGVYEWLTDEKNSERPNYWDDPLGFAEELLSAAHAYKNFADGRLESGDECRYLRNIWHVAHASRQHLVLLLAARRAPQAAFVRLAAEIEKLYFVFLITHQNPNRFESDFVDWASKLRHVTTQDGVDTFLEEYLIPRRHSLAGQFVFAMRDLTEHNIPKYRLKYVLAKLAQHLDEIAYGDDSTDPLAPYLGRKVDIEHILAIWAVKESVEQFGGEQAVRESRSKLANLTLLEKPLNVVVGSKPFADKLPDYLKSKFLLTAGLGAEARVGKDTSVNRALKWVNPYEQWTTSQFRDREDCLVKLAAEVWGVPEVRRESEGVAGDAA
jgi:hypothetical protein